MKITINTNETESAFNIIAQQYIKDNFGGIASATKDGIVTVIASSSTSDWGEASAIENAEYVIDELINDGFTKSAICA